MICRNCLRVASRAQPAIPTTPAARTHRFLTTSSRLSNAAAPSTPPNASSASSPAAAKSTPAGAEQQAAKKKATPLVKSSIPAGVPLKGLNFLKNAQDPVALPDDEYPEWLWTVLDRQEKKDEAGTGDLFSKSKKQRRLAAKRLRKEQAMNPALLIPKIPVYEQTIDLPSGDGTLAGAAVAADARADLTKAMRIKRRASIKEANFLKAMG